MSLNRAEDMDSFGASRHGTGSAYVINSASYAQAPKREPDM